MGEGSTAGRSSGADGVDQLFNFEALRGGASGDNLTGNSGDNFIRGMGGNDVLNGGTGFDYADYRNAEAAVTVTLGDGTAGTSSGADGADTLVNFEGIRGGDFNDRLTGNAADNRLRGGLGDDTLDGAGGADTADYRTATGDVVVTLGNAGAAGRATGNGVDTLLDIEWIQGGDGNDRLTGNAGDNVIRGGLGNDTMNGGSGGDDTASYRFSGAGVTVTLGQGARAGTATGEGTDRLFNFDDLRGSSFDDRLTGNRANNDLAGNDGNDTLTSGVGSDSFTFDTELNASTNVDTIQTFSHGDDVIFLAKDVFSAIVGEAGATLTAGQFALSTEVRQADDRIIYDPGTGQLFYDADGGVRANAVLFAVVSNPATAGVAFDDFVLVA